MNKSKLYFGSGNAKIKGVFTFALPAGWSCPFANACLSKSNKVTGKITDGANAEFRCYAASGESLYPRVRKLLWNNFNLLKNKSIANMVELIQSSLPTNRIHSIIRIHTHGDFFNQDYFDAWLKVIENNPQMHFYAYTKALPFWIKRLNNIPANMVLNASRGGTHDYLIDKYNLKSAEVVFSVKEAKKKGMKIDHDDSLAMSLVAQNFALLIHGAQAAGSAASKAWYAIKRAGGGYGPAKTAFRG